MYGLNIGDHLNDSGQLWSMAWQCYNCGEIVDSLILHNRESEIRPKAGKARLKTFSPSRQRDREKAQSIEF
ncbi:MAG TPA: hypothetical protein DD706_06740 [Nitrospiraceae bacterium]|nr:hypothetical protein [Nitrospiraceae bacterium]